MIAQGSDGSKWRKLRRTYHETSLNRAFLTRLWPRSEHPGPFDDEKKYREAWKVKKVKKKEKVDVE